MKAVPRPATGTVELILASMGTVCGYQQAALIFFVTPNKEPHFDGLQDQIGDLTVPYFDRAIVGPERWRFSGQDVRDWRMAVTALEPMREMIISFEIGNLQG
jgi:hypothetical protein